MACRLTALPRPNTARSLLRLGRASPHLAASTAPLPSPSSCRQTPRLRHPARCFVTSSPKCSSHSIDSSSAQADAPTHSAHHGAFHPSTHRCGELDQHHAGQQVVLAGWLDSLRIVSKHLGFVALRDHTGSVQLVLQADGDERLEALIASTSSMPLQSVVLATGHVQLRPEADRNPSLPSGFIEIRLSSLQLLNPARRDLPFLPSDSQHADRISPEVRARYRYLDLRRKALGDNIRLRSRIAQSIRTHLYDQDFLEIETPILLRSTPEGAREFLVPTRIASSPSSTAGSQQQQQRHPEPSFYALPQSPQQPKQLLIASGVTDRYFQIAKCFRDEDGRKDRQPEFTQIDLEMGFVSGGPPSASKHAAAAATAAEVEVDARDAQGQWRIGGHQVRDVIEGLIARIWAAAGKGSLDHLYEDPGRKRGFPVLSYWTAMTTYGSDKPDLRYGLRISDISSGLRHHEDAAESPSPSPAQNEDVGVALEILPHHHTNAGKLSNKELEGLLAPFRGQVERFRIASWHNTNELAALLLKKSQRVRHALSHHRDGELQASEVDVDRLSSHLAKVLASSRASEGIAADGDGAVDVFVSTRPSPPEGGSTPLGDLRKSLASLLSSKGLLSVSMKPQFAWITEFPLFTLADEDKNELSRLSSGPTAAAAAAAAAAGGGVETRWQSSHHPFTAPMAEDAHVLANRAGGVDASRVGSVRGQHYDLVLDGQEIGGGSVRIHDAAMQRRVFEDVLKLTPSETSRFSHLLHALSCGAPPHGGIALGFDRLMAIVCGATSIRDVIPFPKMGSGVDPVFGSPSTIDDEAGSSSDSTTELTRSDEVLRLYGLRRL
ncbi:uncharacterized protein PFL1_04773 [Pseudozyma flocculosa PF-1]|uniref:Aminoacyl-transfer RNA synthetases class-II family profile domain-containing protein n=1 Tax=Pseudozyma flocculosa PF-1 TaxID=1277687 RepID=A0A061H6K1_9BASI|nr:uncharacterized protein PFL1_04773 [Pseudozyma flocculosa PF-1]EPQ27635.1 hypothetical protein PFL1_04773 [Pseudozyma flocculosa PF-1]